MTCPLLVVNLLCNWIKLRIFPNHIHESWKFKSWNVHLQMIANYLSPWEIIVCFFLVMNIFLKMLSQFMDSLSIVSQHVWTNQCACAKWCGFSLRKLRIKSSYSVSLKISSTHWGQKSIQEIWRDLCRLSWSESDVFLPHIFLCIRLHIINNN